MGKKKIQLKTKKVLKKDWDELIYNSKFFLERCERLEKERALLKAQLCLLSEHATEIVIDGKTFRRIDTKKQE